MEGFLSTFPPFRTACAPQAQGPGWEKREGRFMIPQGLNYLEICKAILSQVNPGLPAPPPPLKGNTKDCGVQVNAKVDKPVQCSLGPKTLFCDSDTQSDSSRSSSPGCGSPDQSHGEDQAQYGSPPKSQVRFLRPVSIYSPLCERRVGLDKLSFLSDSDGEAEAEAERTTPQRPPKSSRFQFLEQRYGFFHCKKCNIRWESAYVWCISGTNKGCSQTCCTCERKQRHINMKRPHRQDLCCRCRGMRLSCDATYSFKYIV
ncbi:protein ZAR1-like isoform X1 [Gouania willdenowi]|uniref:protein ZAR1-like isoform X1 n=1 Tax=Gouania willdenowi TaxID=441366 RepID=UPI001056816C|nr:ZAR1-like protein isoform X1 [Gouania willdenowi]